jgi:phospholipid-transporting ATPase
MIQICQQIIFTPIQRSTVDKLTNTQILMLFFILVVLCVTSAVFNEFGTNFAAGQHWYLGEIREYS